MTRSKKIMAGKPQEGHILNSAKSQSRDQDSPSSKIKVKLEINPATTPEAGSQLSTRPEKKAAGKILNVKREQLDIFKSFSKPTSKLSQEHTGSSTGQTGQIVPAVEVLSVRYSSVMLSSYVYCKFCLRSLG